ncbi:MAG TPA: hypothetical protein PLZ45_00240 [Ferruginibacter sp.]|nr:hypothetical protein [Chitinophagaceae bacterium]HRI23061.1 hypothetical protein [Ferruginibacter sp.]
MHGLHLIFSLLTSTLGIKSLETRHSGLQTAAFIPSEKVITHKLGDRLISIKVVQYGEFVNTCCINLHDDEMTAVKAARSVLEEQGGLLIKIENDAKRNISFSFKGQVYSFDPNRIFSRTGIRLTLKTNGKVNPLAAAEVEKFAAQLLQLIPDSITCLIALHNNTDGDFSVKTYLPGGIRQTDASQVYADVWQDIDDIALTTDQMIYSKMAAQGYNSILQDNINVFKDGSLSVYYGERNRRYINIETQHGKTVQYREMLQKLLNILEEEKKTVTSVMANEPEKSIPLR